MRWLVYGLVLANLGFFLWHYQAREAARERGAEGAAPRDDVTRILLLSEVLSAAPDQGAKGSGAVGPVPVPQLDEAHRTPVPAVPASPRLATAPAAPAPAGPAWPPRAEPAAPAPAPSPTAESPPPVLEAVVASPEPTRQPPGGAATPGPAAPPVASSPSKPPTPPASERPPPLPDAGLEALGPAPAETSAGPAGEVVARGPRCYVLGPVADEAQVAPLRSWLGQHGGQAAQRWVERKEPRSYWVYLPPVGSAAASQELMARLSAEGVRDTLRLSSGKLANGVSLGLFNRQAAAEKRVAELRRLGYEPQVEVRYSVERDAFVDVLFADGQDLPRDALRAAFPRARVEAAECP